MTDQLVANIQNVAPLANDHKWPKREFTWAEYTSLPSYYDGKKVSYNDGATGTQPLYSDVFDREGLNSFGLSAVNNAFSSLNSIAGLKFSRATGEAAANADLHFGAFTSSYEPTAFGGKVGAYSSQGYQTTDDGVHYTRAGDVWFTTASGGNTGSTSPAAQDFALLSMKHELGHIFGLNDTINLQGYNSAHDSQSFTVMSYKSPLTNGHYLSEYQIYDIAALHRLYGQKTDTGSGATTYTMSSFTNSIAPTDSANNRYYSIWDASGDDTINASAANSNSDSAFIDLRPGHFSSIGSTTRISISEQTLVDSGIQNISLAFGTLIENAVGTNFDDVIVGNKAANKIDGGSGNDIIYASGSAVRTALSLNIDVGSIANDDGDYGYFNTTGYHARSLGNDASHTINGNDGDDTIFASAGGDKINGGDGNDRLYGGVGNDQISGGLGDDVIEGGAGADTLNGDDGNDSLSGYLASTDELQHSDDGSIDTIHGGIGDDVLFGYGGDLLFGDDGNDKLVLENPVANSVMSGGAGRDRYNIITSGSYSGMNLSIVDSDKQGSLFVNNKQLWGGEADGFPGGMPSHVNDENGNSYNYDESTHRLTIDLKDHLGVIAIDNWNNGDLNIFFFWMVG